MSGDRMALQRAFTDILLNARRLVDGRQASWFCEASVASSLALACRSTSLVP